MSGTGLNPLPQGRSIVDQNGVMTHEFFWFLNQLMQGIKATDVIDVANIFESQSVTPTVGGLLLDGLGAQVSSAVQRISDLETALSFRPQSPVNQSGSPIIVCTQANFPLLNAANAGSFIWVSDYDHFIYWDGTTPVFADDGTGWIAEGKPDGSAPTGGVWGLCDGSTYAVLKADGTTQNIATINRTDDRFPEGSTTFGAKAATQQTWDAAAVTNDESAHTHQVDPPSTTSGNDSGTGTIVGAGIGATVATHTHTHDTDIAAFTSAAGSAHHHTLTDANAKLKVPSEVNGGLPARVGVSYFMRR